MLRNYFLTAWRNLLKGRLYTLINLSGLAVGSAVCLLILLYVTDEWSYDQFHTKSDRLYRAWVKEHFQGEVFFNTVTPYILGPTLADNLPEVEAMARMRNIRESVRVGERQDDEQLTTVDPEFFQLFDFPLLEGRLFTNKHEILLTPALAEKYFGQASPIGKSLEVNLNGRPQPFLVTGIISAPPTQSTIQFDFLIPFENNRDFASENQWNNWQSVTPETYVLLKENVTTDALDPKIAQVIDRQVTEIYKPGEYVVGLQPITDIHLNRDFPVGIAPVSDGRYPYILGAIGLLILLLASINFTTLAVGRSLSRAREIGVRKVTGATRRQLMGQLWSEAVLIALCAVVLAVGLVFLALPTFNMLSDKALTVDFSAVTIGAWLGLGLLIGLLSGAYPALVLSGFAPLRAIRGETSKRGSERHLVLRGLIGLQFVLSIGLICCALMMGRQLSYLQNKNLGYAKDQLLVFPYVGTPTQEKGLVAIYEEGLQKMEILRQQLGDAAGVEAVTFASHAFNGNNWMQLGFTDEQEKFRRFRLNGVDYNFPTVLDIPIIAGRNFSKDVGTDATQAVIINEAMAKAFGWENPIGQRLPKPFDSHEIIGMVADFNFQSLHTTVDPLVMAVDPVPLVRVSPDLVFDESPLPKAVVRLRGDNLAATVKTIENTWAEVAPDQSFDYYFVDEALDRQYRAEERLSTIVQLATALAIFIACLGLFGMATLTVARRTREIGIRKVLGAPVLSLVSLLNRDFVRLILLATILAAPLSWWLLSRWLDNFAYRTAIAWWVFPLAGLLAAVLAVLTISYQSIRAALANPVGSLRQE